MKASFDTNLGQVESAFADIVWENAPLSTAELVRKCADALGWKRTTTYTVLKKFCERNIFQLENSTVTALVTREAFYAMKSKHFVDETFKGSLASFLSAFTSVEKMSEKEIEEIKNIIDNA